MEKVNNILLVEDDSITNFINDRLLKNMNVATDIALASNGKEAICYLQKKLETENSFPELILLDLNMPVMDGFEFLSQFKSLPEQKRKESLIIVLTTSTHNKDLQKLKESEHIAFLNKPLTKEKVLSIFDKYFPEKLLD